MRRSPGVSLAAVLSLAFGIAASCAVFSVVDALLLQPLPFADPASLVFATETTGPDHALNAVSGPDLVDWRSRAQSFAELGGFRRTQVTLTRLEAPERVDAAAVQPGVFSALRVPPVLGRTLVAADDLDAAVAAVAQAQQLDRQAVRAHVERHFTAERMVDDYLAAYGSALERRAAARV